MKPQCRISGFKSCVGVTCDIFAVQNPNNLRGTFDSKTGGDPRPVNGGLRLTTGTQLGGTAQLGSTAGTQTVLGGTASIGTTPNLVPSTTTQTIGTVSSAVGEFGSRPLQTPGIFAQRIEMHRSSLYWNNVVMFLSDCRRPGDTGL